MLVLYHQINQFGGFRLAVYATAVAVTAYTVVFTALFIGPCNTAKVGSGTCLNNIAIAQAVLNILSDVVLIVLPIPMLNRLNMPFKQRLVTGALLGLGSA